MIAELGQIALILGLVLALIQATLPLAGVGLGNARLIALARPAAAGQFVFLAISFGLLTWAFLVNDFSVLYVANHSNSQLPIYYRFSAVWGGHEGSLLLWALILALWTLAVATFSRGIPDEFVAKVLAVMGVVSVGFLLFTFITSNPFERHLPPPMDGRDLNPLLQDFGLIIHPPMLYMGYVGFSVAFGFAVAALLSNRDDHRWVRWSRPWTNAAWAFLTLGIALGSWWAYYELGWGGWWFWDPVENASFMPWLVGTALIHSQAVSEKRGGFIGWTLLLAIAAFSLSLLGTFLVRSGVLTSVHAFASDPDRGLFILIFLGVVTGTALLLYALRAPRQAEGKAFGPLSRDTLLLVNNLLFASSCVLVLAGTLYPLYVDVTGQPKLSVGPDFFGPYFIAFMAPVVALMVLGPFTRWGGDSLRRVTEPLKLALAISVILTAALWYLDNDLPLKALVGILGGSWVILGTLTWVWRRMAKLRASGGRFTAEQAGMVAAHLGVGVFVVGVFMTESTSIERDVAMAPGDSFEMRHYRFQFDGVEHRVGPNFEGDKGVVRVFRGEREIAVLHPEKRMYQVSRQVMTEAAIDPGFTRDIYVAMGEPLDRQGTWALRLYHKPFIRWIWLGALMMTLGGFLVAADRRFRARAEAEEPTPRPSATLAATEARA